MAFDMHTETSDNEKQHLSLCPAVDVKRVTHCRYFLKSFFRRAFKQALIRRSQGPLCIALAVGRIKISDAGLANGKSTFRRPGKKIQVVMVREHRE